MEGPPRAELRTARVDGVAEVRMACTARLDVCMRGHAPHSGHCHRALRHGIPIPIRHSDRAFNDRRGVRRGFLPRGLSDTCPQAGADRRLPACPPGQVSDNPKQLPSLTLAQPQAAPVCSSLDSGRWTSLPLVKSSGWYEEHRSNLWPGANRRRDSPSDDCCQRRRTHQIDT